MDMQTIYAEYEYRRRIRASQSERTVIWRRIMG
jgi:hypothetical protein